MSITDELRKYAEENECKSYCKLLTAIADRIECVETVGGMHYDIHIMECTECGHTYEHVNGDYEYCPRCGRKREDVSE